MVCWTTEGLCIHGKHDKGWPFMSKGGSFVAMICRTMEGPLFPRYAGQGRFLCVHDMQESGGVICVHAMRQGSLSSINYIHLIILHVCHSDSSLYECHCVCF